ncbi:hypothetical protein CD58_19875 [Pseudomonas brassicacearum]|nr:hypothetical protein CD58_19875 [Pseudomonas brassicacearum]
MNFECVPSSIPCGEGACSRWAAQQTLCLGYRVVRFQGRFAPQREQAPSPHGIGVDWQIRARRNAIVGASLLAMRPASLAQNQQAKKTGATEVAPVVLPMAARMFVGPHNHR